MCVKAPSLIEKIGLGKKGAVTLAFTNMLVWVPLIFAFLLSHLGITPVWLTVLWLVNIIPGLLLSFQRDNWLSNLIPHQTLGRYLGQRLAIKSAFYIAAFFCMGYMLDSFGEKSPASFAFVFILALVMALADYLVFSRIREPAKSSLNNPESGPGNIRFGVFDFIKELNQKKLDKFILFTAFINVSIGFAGPFYAVYMLQEQNFTYVNFTLIISVEFLARVVSGPFWGRLADKAGNIKVLTIVSRIIPVLPVCWLFSTNIAYMAFLQILSGICWGAFDLSTQSYLYKVAPRVKKLRYIVYTRSIMLFAAAAGGILGACLVNVVFSTFGSKLLTMIMISGIFRAVVVMFLMPKLVDLAISHSQPVNPGLNLELVRKPAVSRRGLFYHQPETEKLPVTPDIITWHDTSSRAPIMHRRNLEMEERLAEARVAKRELIELTEAVRTGRKRNRAVYGMQEKKDPGRPLEITPLHRPLYGDGRKMSAYKSAVSALKTAREDSGFHEGIFHDNTAWARYLRETMQDFIKESRVYKTADRKPVIIRSRRPEATVSTRTYAPSILSHGVRFKVQPATVNI